MSDQSTKDPSKKPSQESWPVQSRDGFLLTEDEYSIEIEAEEPVEWQLPRIQLQPESDAPVVTKETVADWVARELSEPGDSDVLPEPHRRFVSLDHKQLQMDLSPQLKMGEILDQGGLGLIRRGFDVNLQRWVAVKTLQMGKRIDPVAVRRLIEEAQIMAQLDHPSIVPVHKIGLDNDGTLFFTMKLVEGETLLTQLERQDFQLRSEKELQQQLQIFLRVCDAIAFAHSRGVIHGDLNPTHVMVGDFGQVYVMDWGLAHLKNQVRPSERGDVFPIDWEIARRKERALATMEAPTTGDAQPRTYDAWLLNRSGNSGSSSWNQEEKSMGLLGYMAPEQTRKQRGNIDERTDVFALGGLLYKILTKQPVYQMDSLPSVLAQASQGTIVPPNERSPYELPRRLCNIAHHALRHDPDQRYRSVQVLQEEIRDFLESGWQFKRRLFPANSTIVREGDVGHEAYIITQGRCRVYKTVNGEKVVLRDMGAGEVFGETAVFTAAQTRTASVESMEPVTLAVVTEKHFEEDLGIGYWLSLFIRALAARFRERDQLAAETDRALESTLLSEELLQYILQHGESLGHNVWGLEWEPLAALLQQKGVMEPLHWVNDCMTRAEMSVTWNEDKTRLTLHGNVAS